MSTTKLVIRKGKINSKGECVIFVLYTHDQKSVYFSTGKKIDPDFWDKAGKKVKKSFRGFTEMNKAIEAREDEIQKIANLALSLGVDPSVDYVRTKDDEIKKGKKNTKSADLFPFIISFIEDAAINRKPATLSVYRTTLSHLEGYTKKRLKRGKQLTFESIDLDFYQSFTEYLINDLGYSNNTLGKYIKTIKTFMNEATDRGVNKNLSFKKRRFKVITEETDAIYFNEREIEKLYQLDLREHKRLERVRDLFIVGCWVGLRFSDLSQVRPENFIEEGNSKLLRIRTIKTDQAVYVPLHRTVIEILAKYNGSLPEAISNQKTNEYLKEICQKAGFNTLETLATYRGAVRTDQAIPKYQLVSTHTARRSFATNLFLQKVPSYTIMQITGHKTEKAFLRYIKVSAKEHAKLLGLHWEKTTKH